MSPEWGFDGAREVLNMESRASVLGHAVHPMLISFPLGLLATSVVFDILYLITGVTGLAVAAFYTIAAGIVGGVLAGVFGVIDWLALSGGTRAKSVGRWHGVGNTVMLVLFVISWALRAGADTWHPGAVAVIVSLIAAAVAGASAWLGGELVERLGIGVAADAHPDAPGPLSRYRSRG